MSNTDGETSTIHTAGQALFRLVRILTRKPMHRTVADDTGRTVELSHIHVAEAVAELEQTQGEITVGMVADQLDLDPSTASRMVADTIQAGYLSRAQAEVDNRRSILALTQNGRELVKSAQHYQQSIFGRYTADWTDEERDNFSRLLLKFYTSVAVSKNEPS